jgi:class 3 adenylate cyclase
VGSTEVAAGLGDRRWRDLLDQHNTLVRRELGRFRGQELSTAGDGFLATFDGPARAVACAVSIRDAARTLGLEIRFGLHTGELELAGSEIGGIAIHTGARVAAKAGPGEVLTSSTVKDLVVSSGLVLGPWLATAQGHTGRMAPLRRREHLSPEPGPLNTTPPDATRPPRRPRRRGRRTHLQSRSVV